MTSKESFDASENISWAAYHASHGTECEIVPGITSLLPLFTEDSKAAAMIRHSMDVIKNAVQHVNIDQIPVITFDQPLYTLAKQIQWNWPDIYGEHHFVIMLGGFHTEMTFLKCLGNWLAESGWTNAITQAQIASSGTADSLLKESHVTRARYAHQVTASSLHLLLRDAFAKYHGGVPEEHTLNFENWVSKRIKESPHFQYWHITLHLELLVLIFVRSIREGNFPLYVESLTKFVPWLFALNHTNYARWLPVHIQDMATLQTKLPEIFSHFVSGNFVIHKTQRKFSAISIDQAHEQNNALIKGDGGAVGLTENPAAFQRWMTAGPELARVVTEFEENMKSPQKQPTTKHHEQTKGMQSSFYQDVKELVKVIEEMGNPYLDETEELLVLDNKEVASPDVLRSLQIIEKCGQDQYQAFVDERLKKRSKSVFDPIKRNNLHLFHKKSSNTLSKSKIQAASMKSDCSLFARLYIACQVREGNLDTFFKHENGPFPPSLSNNGQLRQGTKSDIVDCLENLVQQIILSIHQ